MHRSHRTTPTVVLTLVLAAGLLATGLVLALRAPDGRASDSSAHHDRRAAHAAEPDARFVVNVMSGRPQPPPSEWRAEVGDRIEITALGIGPPRFGVVGPGLGEVWSSAWGRASEPDGAGGEHLRFTISSDGVYHVGLLDDGTPLARLVARGPAG